MTVPREQVIGYLNDTVDIVIQRVREKADTFFNSEIVSSGNGTASPFQKMLMPEVKLASLVERSFTASLGKSFDYIAAGIARATYGNGEHDYSVSGAISAETLAEIDAIIEGYRSGAGPPDTAREIERVESAVDHTVATLTRSLKSDVFFVDNLGVEYYLEIKTPMPNYDTCKAVKTRILTILALRRPERANTRALAVFPHNPNGLAGAYSWPPLRYFLDPTRDWALDGVPLMGPGLWNFLGNSESTYGELLDCFYKVSIERREEILELISREV